MNLLSTLRQQHAAMGETLSRLEQLASGLGAADTNATPSLPVSSPFPKRARRAYNKTPETLKNEIRALYDQGLMQKDIVKKTGKSLATVSRVIRGLA